MYYRPSLQHPLHLQHPLRLRHLLRLQNRQNRQNRQCLPYLCRPANGSESAAVGAVGHVRDI